MKKEFSMNPCINFSKKKKETKHDFNDTLSKN